MTKIHLQSKYSDIVSDGGLDPRNEYEKKFKQKPLTEEEIRWLVGGDDEAQEWNRKVVKAVELAHGIGVEE